MFHIARLKYHKLRFSDMGRSTESDYIPRLIDDVLTDDLRLFGGVVITGPRWCGKTTTAERVARNLLKLKDKIDSDEVGEPAFMAVVTADGAAYTREDGIHVIPLSCLRN